jgi:ribosome biogenesis protein SSF1/2
VDLGSLRDLHLSWNWIDLVLILTFSRSIFGSVQGKHKKKGKKPQPELVDGYVPPKSFIFKRGKVGQTVKTLVEDMRLVMSPNTAVNLKEQEKNSIKDFVNVSGQLGITQFFVFSATEVGTYMRLLRIPAGPSLTFRVMNYSLMSDIHKLQSRPKSVSAEIKQCAPILILNNFSGEENHVKIMASAFQNAFPALNVHTMKLKDAKRVVLIHYDKTDSTIEFRHYLISTTQLGLQKSVKRILQRKVSDLGDMDDISEYILSQTGATESDAEDMANDDAQVDLPDTLNTTSRNRRKKAARAAAATSAASAENGEDGNDVSVAAAGTERKLVQSAVRLSEVGPRMQLKLLKVEEGLNEGMVLYHALKTKTEKEIEALERKRARAAAAKEQRRREQEERVARKKGLPIGNDGEEADDDGSDEEASSSRPKKRSKVTFEDHEDYNYERAPEEVIQRPDDVEWYRQEVGEEPTEEEKRLLRASQPAMPRQNKFNPHWGKKSKKRSGDEVSGGRAKSEDSKPAKKKFKSISGAPRRSK